jgi:hypothetical protein
MDIDEIVSNFANALAALLIQTLDQNENEPELVSRLSEELRKASTEVDLIARR